MNESGSINKSLDTMFCTSDCIAFLLLQQE